MQPGTRDVTDEIPVVSTQHDHEMAFERRKSRHSLIAVTAIGALVLAAVIGFAGNRSKPFRRTAGPIRVSGWVPYWQTDSSLASFTTNSAMFSDVSVFAWSTIGADNIRAEAIDPNAIAAFRSAAHNARVPLIATVFDGMAKGQLASLLADPTSRRVHVDSLVKLVNELNFDGIDLDYEQFAFADGRDSWATTRPNWVTFINELSVPLHAAGKKLIVSAPPIYDKSRSDSSGYWVYDFEAIAPFVDSVRVMAYDYSTSEPGPIAPINWVSRVIEGARSMLPDTKIMLGVPVYGYSWVTSVSGGCPADQKPQRRNLSTRSAAELATTLGLVPTRDPDSGENTLTYSDQLTGLDVAGAPTACTVTRIAWYLDAKAIFQRAALAYHANLAGISLWSLGNDDDLSWEGILAAGAGIADWPPSSAP